MTDKLQISSTFRLLDVAKMNSSSTQASEKERNMFFLETLNVAGTFVPAEDYRMVALPSPKSSKLIFNLQRLTKITGWTDILP